nr:glycosyltransferase [uncultured Eisenbergiella sp.]
MKKMYLVTNGFPFDRSEDPFIIPELKELITKYDVTIISCVMMSVVLEEERNLFELIGKNIPVYQYRVHRKNIWQILRSIFLCFHPIFLKEVIDIIKTRTKFLGRLWRSYLFFTQSDDFYRWLRRKKIIEIDKEGIFYTYWNVYYSFHMGVYRKCYPNLKLISRLHGYDLYDFVEPYGRQPFKETMNSTYDKLVFISEHGKKYYCEKYNQIKNIDKYPVCKLGIEAKIPYIKKGNFPFLLVSCSTISSVKRVWLIVEGLEKIQDCQIKWVHFGDGEEKEDIINLAKKILKLKKNIEYVFMGKQPNNAVLDYYKQYYPSCIINVSESEGSPVSIQEALAFGTPVIATDVGGNSELIENNGYLLPANPSPEQIACAIRYVAQADIGRYQEMRKQSYILWDKEYNRKKNTEKFLEVLEGL